ncbi:MAG: A/G-specific adenine glycosylase, partial [Mangrovibacterium sp.]
MESPGDELLRWYTYNKRELPWRETKDPYSVWLSEVILQQTRVDQGLAYYMKFIRRFPSVGELASADEDEVLKLWQGLGYYSRARNLLLTARMVQAEFGGRFPANYDQLLRLKGIGAYTAAAVASVCFKLPHAVVDGNVYRFLSRFYGITTPVNSTAGKKEFAALANQILDRTRPGEYNQAIMEFGALYCKPQNPDCLSCILSHRCIAFAQHSVNRLPVKTARQKIRSRFFNYILIRDHSHTYIRKRTAADIWENLYEFPLIETTDKADHIDEKLQEYMGNEEIAISKITGWDKQVLSHQCIYYRFIYVE